MTGVYTEKNEKIKQLEEEIANLEYQQNKLKEQLETNNEEYAIISEKLEECYKRLNEYNSIKNVFDNFKYKDHDIKTKIRKKILKFGIPSLVLSWFIGGAIANSVIGAVVGATVITATIVGSALAYYNHKLKHDKEVIKNNNIRRIKRKIMHEENNKKNYLKRQKEINLNNDSINRFYNSNAQQLEQLRITKSIFEPTTSTKQKRPYTKFKSSQ